MVTVVLDSGPLGLLSNPRSTVTGRACVDWMDGLLRQGVLIVVPEIADYEVRRELIRSQKARGLQRLDSLVASLGYLPITTNAMHRAAEFWAQSRQAGRPAANPKALDGDMILAAQALTMQRANVVIATTNTKHFTMFCTAVLWSDIGSWSIELRKNWLPLLAAVLLVTGARSGRSAEPDKYDLARRQCIDEAKKGASFRSCGYDKGYGSWLVTWPQKGEWVEPDLHCPAQRASSAVVDETTHLVLACNWKIDSLIREPPSIIFSIAHLSFRDPVYLKIGCSCKTLEADRLHFDVKKRLLTFNLATDASAIKVEERELQLPATKVNSGEKIAVMTIPIFRVEFNEHWQIVRVNVEQK